MAQPKGPDDLPTPQDTFQDGTKYPLGAHRFDQATATDQPIGPEPDEPSGPLRSDSGN